VGLSARDVGTEVLPELAGAAAVEVIDAFGNHTIWNDQFDTDQQALDEVSRTILDEGIGSLVSGPGGMPQ